MVVPVTGFAANLLADISEHRVQIDLGFTGKQVLLYGAIEGTGNVVVLVRGPREAVTIRRKARIAGVWANDVSAIFDDAISFYQVMVSAELDEWLPFTLRERHQIGVEYLDFKLRNKLGAAERADFLTALIRTKRRLGHYGELEGRVSILGGKLFRTEIFFPANVPTGIYTVEALLVRNGEMVSAQKTPLYVTKTGIEAEIFNLAHEHPEVYGIIAIIIAVAAGLAANAGALRR
tara:strand:+ start:184 stop:885 length:702 start_codon:yes stop_codon:yes gene_type:complete